MITKNSKRATVSKIIKRDGRTEGRDIPSSISSQLEEQTEGFILFYVINGKLCVRCDRNQSDPAALGLQIMAKEYLDTVIGEGKDFQRSMILERIDEF